VLDKHALLTRLEHLHSRIRDRKSQDKEELCELLDLFEMVVFDVYGELENLDSSRCGLMQKANCIRNGSGL
jgi:hypothetical protein